MSEDFEKLIVPFTVNPQLSAMGVLFRREHNRLANNFHHSHPEWDDETLFQEARR